MPARLKTVSSEGMDQVFAEGVRFALASPGPSQPQLISSCATSLQCCIVHAADACPAPIREPRVLLCSSPPQREQTRGAAEPSTVGLDLWGEGVGETGSITACGGSGKAEERMLYCRGCRESEEEESPCFWTSLGTKLGLGEGRGR